jgi:hypothetical protein
MALSEVTGRAIIAARTHVSGDFDPSVRLFIGEAAGYGPGEIFDSYNTATSHFGAPCGVWTVFGVVTDGQVTQGTVPDNGHASGKFITFELLSPN